MADKRKVFTSAVILCPPKSIWDPIQKIRQKHDKAYERWMPHVNLIFPFVPDINFPDSVGKLAAALKANVTPFEVTFDSLKYFSHGKSCTLWLNPSPVDKVKHLQQVIVNTFPFCDDLSNRSEDGFTPHLSVGQWPPSQIEAAQKQFTPTTIPQLRSFLAESIDVISRVGDTPFEVRYTIKFDGTIIPVTPISASPSPSSKNSKKVYVGKLSPETTVTSLTQIFTAIGLSVASANLVTNPNGKCKGFGFVEFNSEEDKQKALKASLSVLVKEPN